MTLREVTGFQDLQPVRSGDLVTLVVSQDATFTAPAELVVFDGSVTSIVLGIIGIFTMPLLLGLLANIFGAVALGIFI